MVTPHSTEKRIVLRPVTVTDENALSHFHPVLARIFLARGIRCIEDLDLSLSQLPQPTLLSGIERGLTLLTDALKEQQRILIVADYDADGATSCAVAVLGLQMLGAKHVDFIVPDRFTYGYGLTPEIVDLIAENKPDLLITVDNGIASFEGVARAHTLGIKVFVTDHHLPAELLPQADAIVNPNLKHDEFPSKSLAGVGVIFYVLLALRTRLRQQLWFSEQNIQEPNLGQLLDLVALGTIADVVPLDKTNRALVYQGLLRIRNQQGQSGIHELIKIANKNHQTINTGDLGFSIAPRLNAAGRMDDMSIGIRCLLTKNLQEARSLALQLDELNQERREVEARMRQEAMALLSDKNPQRYEALFGICLYDENWHQGVIGILASRIKEQVHRPVIAFASAGPDLIKGSARSIPGIHIRDVLSEIATLHPKLLSKFGGHAMAAGLSIAMHDFPTFSLIFDQTVQLHLANVELEEKIYSDGQLSDTDMTLAFTRQLQSSAIWGQGFPEPLFHGTFNVIQVRLVGQHHLKLVLRLVDGEQLVDGIAFFVDSPEQYLGMRRALLAYKLDSNEYRNECQLQLVVQYIEKLA